MKRHRRTLRPPAELLHEHLRAALRELKRLGKQRAIQHKQPQPAAEAPPGLALLKPDQRKLIRMVVTRSSDQLEQLANELHIHRRTMSNRLRKIYKLLGVDSRPGLAREAVRWGLV
jgi:DNA-binding CsgD family transcriptional regulator